MSLLLLLAATIGKSQAQFVNIIGASVTDETLTPDNAVARYTISSDGDEYTDITGEVAQSINTWLLFGAAADYEASYTCTGDTAALEGTFAADGTWYSCDDTPFWEISDTSQVGSALSVTGTVSIRSAASELVLDTATLTLTAHESA